MKRWHFGSFLGEVKAVNDMDDMEIGEGDHIKFVLASDFDMVVAELAQERRQMAVCAQQIDDQQQRVDLLETALAGMLFAFDDGVGREWSEDLLDFARKLTAAKEFKAALKPAEGGGDE